MPNNYTAIWTAAFRSSTGAGVVYRSYKFKISRSRKNVDVMMQRAEMPDARSYS